MATYKSALCTVCAMSFFLNVNAISTCKQSVINEILNTNNRPADVLSKLNKLSPFTYTVNPKGSMPDYVKCANGQIDAPVNGKSNALVTAYYKDTSRAAAKIKYVQQDLGDGHIKEWGSEGKAYDIYVLQYDTVFCYYRCTTDVTDGSDFGACGVPVSKINDPNVQDEIEYCKAKLRAVGITGDLVDLVACNSA